MARINTKDAIIGAMVLIPISGAFIAGASYFGSIGNNWTVEQAGKNARNYLEATKQIDYKIAPPKSDTDRDGNTSVAVSLKDKDGNFKVIVLRCDNRWFIQGSCNPTEDINGSRLNQSNSKGRSSLNTWLTAITGSTDSIVKNRASAYLQALMPVAVNGAIIEVKYNSDDDDNNTVTVLLPGQSLEQATTLRCDNQFATFGFNYKGGCVPTQTYTGRSVLPIR